jgi:hypothetical protein
MIGASANASPNASPAAPTASAKPAARTPIPSLTTRSVSVTPEYRA